MAPAEGCGGGSSEGPSVIALSPAEVSDGDAVVQREWLVTNGIGGYAMGTVNGARARSYHGMLVAALQPPVGRWLMAGGLDDSVFVGDDEFRFAGSAAVGEEGSIERTSPAAELSFHVDGGTPVWVLETPHARVEKRVFMAHGRNTSYARYTVARADQPVRLRGAATAAFRDHHQTSRPAEEAGHAEMGRVPHGVRVRLNPEAALQILGDGVSVRPTHHWRRGEYLAIEDERGFDCVEDELVVAEYECQLAPGRSVTVVFSAEDAPEFDGEAAYAAHREREAGLLEQAELESAPDGIRQLVFAADQFVVARALEDGTQGHSVIAGYPWFGDWGRDTMIALPGLTLATGRAEIARGILTTFARYVDQGMLPNRFPDSGDAPEYNTADATLWYFEAVCAYHRATGDLETIRALFPVLADIVVHHLAGTRYGIGVDPADGLLRAGVPGENLTWMDAKVDGVVMTPRHGKAVELSALWINALAAMRDFAALLGEPDSYSEHLARASASFARFWDDERGYLRDVLDPDDATLRPNQLIAAMLDAVPLTTAQRRGIVEACREALYTPVGMRTLRASDPNYRGVFAGDWRTRDAMYHQGPAWSWLLGPFVSAHLRAYGDPVAARELLDAALAGLSEGCVGSVSELFDGDAPHHPRAASAQAWGVSELLRVWREIDRYPGVAS
ncbi:amylo-alpha-1,6-glucosidase [Tessaracoccus caeni]|uniref:amylo-alpha-1,6-glucosidase n=1 Tax=Tessaracoccus caeni TaxID=3031239 RepID=UPI0023DA8191|nr:amylo-alpha-1,6-glucosidase [Tessaracoccus caeni]MDF1487311.1 amylo-alpha-1,6-glucosidase [Tessaracoccus caeni]